MTQNNIQSKQQLQHMLNNYIKTPTTKRNTKSGSFVRIILIYCMQWIQQLPPVLPQSVTEIERSVKMFLARGNRKPTSNRTIAHALCGFLEWAVLLPPEVADKIIGMYPLPSADWSSKALTRTEQRELLNALRTRGMQFSRIRDYTLTALMLLSGVRVSQATAITTWGITNGVLWFEVQRQKNKDTSTRTKQIPLSIRLPDDTYFSRCIELYLLARTKAGHNKSEYLFPARNGKQLTQEYLRYYYNKYAPFKVTPHTMRHTAGTTIANNVSVPSASAVLDHASIQTTMRYIKPPESTEDILRTAWGKEE